MIQLCYGISESRVRAGLASGHHRWGGNGDSRRRVRGQETNANSQHGFRDTARSRRSTPVLRNQVLQVYSPSKQSALETHNLDFVPRPYWVSETQCCYTVATDSKSRCVNHDGCWIQTRGRPLGQRRTRTAVSSGTVIANSNSRKAGREASTNSIQHREIRPPNYAQRKAREVLAQTQPSSTFGKDACLLGRSPSERGRGRDHRHLVRALPFLIKT